MRPGALAGFVRIDAALDAPADCRADAGHRRERVADDQHDDARQLRDVQGDDADGHEDVAEGHERHDDLRDVGDALDAAEDDDAEDGHDDHGGRELRVADIAETGLQHAGAAERELRGVADGIRLHGGQQQADGNNGRQRKDPCVPLLAHGFFDVIGGAAAELAFLLFLVDLAEGGLDVGRGRTEEGDDPHPEDRTGSAEADGRRDTGDVAGTDPARERNRQGLERGDTAIRFLAGIQQPDHLAEEAHLDKPGQDGEEQARSKAQVNEHRTPDIAIDLVNDLLHAAPD